MADISKEIENFREAIEGEEVRGSMISLAEKVNAEVEVNTEHVNAAVATANEASQTANEAAAEAQEAITQADITLGAANAAKESAQESAAASSNSAAAAAESEGAAGVSASAAKESAAEALRISEGLGGFDGSAESVSAVDVQGLVAAVGEKSNVQALIDVIADKVMTKLLAKSQIVNNLLATEPGNVLDATQGAVLKKTQDQLISDFVGKRGELSNAVITAAGGELFYLSSGVYHARMEDTKYLPFQWGTLIVEKSDIKYGTVKLYDTKGKSYYRSFSNDSTEHVWLHDWVSDSNSAMYAITIHVVGTSVFSFQSKFDAIVSSGNTSRQSIFMFLSVNSTPVHGMLDIANKGVVSWNGTGNVTAKMASNGRVSVTLPNTAYDVVTLISGDVIAK